MHFENLSPRDNFGDLEDQFELQGSLSTYLTPMVYKNFTFHDNRNLYPFGPVFLKQEPTNFIWT